MASSLCRKGPKAVDVNSQPCCSATTCFLFVGFVGYLHIGSLGQQWIGHDEMWSTKALRCLSEGFQRRHAITTFVT